jgi:hypothetical protein
MHRVAGLPAATGSGVPNRNHGGTPTAPEDLRFGGAIGVGTGNRVSVNGARSLGRATGSESSFGNGGRATDQTGSKGHRCRVTGGGAIGTGPGNRCRVENGHRPPCLRARRAMCRSRRRLTPGVRVQCPRRCFAGCTRSTSAPTRLVLRTAHAAPVWRAGSYCCYDWSGAQKYAPDPTPALV